MRKIRPVLEVVVGRGPTIIDVKVEAVRNVEIAREAGIQWESRCM